MFFFFLCLILLWLQVVRLLLSYLILGCLVDREELQKLPIYVFENDTTWLVKL